MNNNSSYRMDDILLKHLAEVLSFRIWKLSVTEGMEVGVLVMCLIPTTCIFVQKQNVNSRP